MRGLLIVFYFLPWIVFAQQPSKILITANIEQNGLAAALGIDLPSGATLNQISLNGPQKLFEVRFKNHVVKDFQISWLCFGEQSLVSWNCNSQAQFIESDIEASSKAEWVSTDGSRTFRLMEYHDTEGFRTYQCCGSKIIVSHYRYSGKDTTALAKIFLPDPLSPQNLLYGGVYRDQKNANYSEMDALYKTVTLACNFENDSFRLTNEWISFSDITSPYYSSSNPKAISKTPEFLYTRDQSQFEEVNAFWHFTELGKWWDTLGFASYRDTVVVDVHALGGGDESAFNDLVHPHTIEFGDGGVDDAEDADAVVHEYTHAAFSIVIPKSYAGTQRQAIEEGICDFMALAYSSRYTQNQKSWVYNWDGHNEFWEGRELNNQRYYPVSLTNQPHVDGQLFGAALFDLSKDVGMDSAVKMVMATMPVLVAGLNMRQVARLFLQVDSLRNDGRMNWNLTKAFWSHGLLPEAEINAPPKPQPNIRNSENFAKGLGPLEIVVWENTNLEVFTTAGKKVEEIALIKDESTFLYPENFASGVYILKAPAFAFRIAKF